MNHQRYPVRVFRWTENLTTLCVTAQNVHSLPDYPKMVQELGIEDVHLDMVRPWTPGTVPGIPAFHPPRYTVIAQEVESMLQRFLRGNAHVGNLLTVSCPTEPMIFHDGVQTQTFAANGRNAIDDG